MSDTRKGGLIRRNTAVALSGVLSQPAMGMMDASVPDGALLFGFDATDPANEMLVFAANDDATREPNQHYQTPFMLYTWAVKHIILAADEKTAGGPHARLVLMDKDGETLSFVSQGALSSFDLIRTMRGDGPYDPPLPILVGESKTRHGFRVFKLRIAAPVSPPPIKK